MDGRRITRRRTTVRPRASRVPSSAGRVGGSWPVSRPTSQAERSRRGEVRVDEPPAGGGGHAPSPRALRATRECGASSCSTRPGRSTHWGTGDRVASASRKLDRRCRPRPPSGRGRSGRGRGRRRSHRAGTSPRSRSWPPRSRSRRRGSERRAAGATSPSSASSCRATVRPLRSLLTTRFSSDDIVDLRGRRVAGVRVMCVSSVDAIASADYQLY